jgi:hypothetical protein
MISTFQESISTRGVATGLQRNRRPWQDTARSEEIPAPPPRRQEVPRTEVDQVPVTPESSSQPIRNLREFSGTALFSIKQRYFGYVTTVHDDYIEVQLTDERTGEYADAEIPKEMIKVEDYGLLHEGLEFVWIFGYEATSSLKQSAILYIPRFRPVTEDAIAAERARVDSVMDAIFGPLNPTETDTSGA